MEIMRANALISYQGGLVRWPLNRVVALIAAILLALLCHNAFMHFVYWQRFHSDAAVAYVVAEQILAEGRLFPQHFNFGNDIYLLRPQFAIALLLKAGMGGYSAYALATSIMFSAAFGAVASVLMLCRPNQIGTPLLATALLFIPIGINDCDYILGQQSHLLQCSLALVATILCYRISRAGAGPYGRAILLVVMGLLALDSIMRAIIVALAIVVASTTLLPWRRRTFVAVGICGVGLLLGLAVRTHVVLGMQFLGINMRPDIGYGAIAMKTRELWHDLGTVAFSTHLVSMPDLGAIVFSVAHLATLAALVGVTLWLLIGTAIFALERLRGGYESHSSVNMTVFVLAVGLLVTAAGLGAALIGNIGAVSRHALPGIFLIKFTLTWLIADACFATSKPRNHMLGWSAAAMLVLASPVTLPVISPFYRQGELEQRASLTAELVKLRELQIVQIGRGRMYGEFWDAYRYGLLSGSTLSPAPVAVWGKSIVGNSWLSIPERFCAAPNQSNVYIVKNSDPQMLDLMSHARERVNLTPHLTVFIDPGRDLTGCRRF